MGSSASLTGRRSSNTPLAQDAPQWCWLSQDKKWYTSSLPSFSTTGHPDANSRPNFEQRKIALKTEREWQIFLERVRPYNVQLLSSSPFGELLSLDRRTFLSMALLPAWSSCKNSILMGIHSRSIYSLKRLHRRRTTSGYRDGRGRSLSLPTL